MSEKISVAAIKNSWLTRGFSCHLWHDAAGKEWIDYIHDTDELLMLLEGNIEITLEGKTFRPKIGDEVLIPQKTHHTVRNVGKTENRWLYGYKAP